MLVCIDDHSSAHGTPLFRVKTPAPHFWHCGPKGTCLLRFGRRREAGFRELSIDQRVHRPAGPSTSGSIDQRVPWTPSDPPPQWPPGSRGVFATVSGFQAGGRIYGGSLRRGLATTLHPQLGMPPPPRKPSSLPVWFLTTSGRCSKSCGVCVLCGKAVRQDAANGAGKSGKTGGKWLRQAVRAWTLAGGPARVDGGGGKAAWLALTGCLAVWSGRGARSNAAKQSAANSAASAHTDAGAANSAVGCGKMCCECGKRGGKP
eukprot:gene23739-biopygen23853